MARFFSRFFSILPRFFFLFFCFRFCFCSGIFNDLFFLAMTKENINADVKYTIGSFDFEKSDYSFQIQHPIHGTSTQPTPITKLSLFTRKILTQRQTTIQTLGVQRHAEKFSKDAQCNFFYGSDAIKWFEKKEKKGMTTEGKYLMPFGFEFQGININFVISDALDQLESMKNCGLFSSNSKKVSHLHYILFYFFLIFFSSFWSKKNSKKSNFTNSLCTKQNMRYK